MRRRFKKAMAVMLSMAMMVGLLASATVSAEDSVEWYYSTLPFTEMELNSATGNELTANNVFKQSGNVALTGTLLDYNGMRSYALKEYEKSSSTWTHKYNHIFLNDMDCYMSYDSPMSPQLWSHDEAVTRFMDNYYTTGFSNRLSEIVTDSHYSVLVTYVDEILGEQKNSITYVGAEVIKGISGLSDNVAECIEQGKCFETNINENDDTVLISITPAQKITINANGGKCNTLSAWRYCANSNRTAWTSDFNEIPTREGYEFEGWYDSKEGGRMVTFQKLTTNTIHARWSPYQYSIVFNANTGEGEMESQTLEYDQEAAISKNVYTKKGYVFCGWNTMADGSGDFYADEQAVKNLCVTDGGTINLYAQWKPAKYTLQFHANTAEGEMEDQEMTYDLEEQISLCKFKKSGYDFDSWNTKADGTGVEYLDEQAVKNLCVIDGEIINLYAQWKKQTVAPNPTATSGIVSGGSITKVSTGAGVGDSSIDSDTKKFSEGQLTYKITGKKAVEVVKAAKGIKKVSLNTVKWNGKTYQVASVGKAAFKNCKNLKSVTIGKNVKTIKANAFYGCKNLAKISIKSTKLTMGKHALKKTKATCKYSFPKVKKKAYKKMVKKARK